MNKLAVFDFDSTLMQGETIAIIASIIGLQKEVEDITQRTMSGELDFFESLSKRVALLKGIEEKKVNDICMSLNYTKGASKIIADLKRNGYLVVCFSGGFKNATVPAKKILGYDEEFSNILHSKDGILTGKVGGEMLFGYSKGYMLQKLQNILRISSENTLVVGDGANDLSMFKFAGNRVAFCAKPVLKEQANIIIDDNDLSLISNYIRLV